MCEREYQAGHTDRLRRYVLLCVAVVQADMCEREYDVTSAIPSHDLTLFG